MDLVTHSVLVMSAAMITLGLLYLRFWITQTDRLDFLFFTFACISAAIYAWFEIGIMSADSIERMSQLLWWSQIPAGIAIISVASFLYRNLNAGNKWLFWAMVTTRTFGILLNLALPMGIV